MPTPSIIGSWDSSGADAAAEQATRRAQITLMVTSRRALIPPLNVAAPDFASQRAQNVADAGANPISYECVARRGSE